MTVKGEFSESFAVEVGVRQGCMKSLWLFNIIMDGCMKKMKAKVESAGALLRLNGEDCVIICLFVDDTLSLAESIGELQRVVNEFCSVCKRWKPIVNAGMSKVMVSDRREGEVVDSKKPVVPNLIFR